MKATIIRDPGNKFFPIRADWTINGLKYYNVFSTTDEARAYLIGRYGKITIKEVTQ